MLLTDEEKEQIRELWLTTKHGAVTKAEQLIAIEMLESAVLAKLREQKPFAWACWLNNDTEQKPIDCRISTLEPTAYPIRRKLFIHPAPIPASGYYDAENARLRTVLEKIDDFSPATSVYEIKQFIKESLKGDMPCNTAS